MPQSRVSFFNSVFTRDPCVTIMCVCVCVCVYVQEREKKERRWNEDGLSVLPSISDTLIYFFYCYSC